MQTLLNFDREQNAKQKALNRVLRGVVKWFPAEHRDALANRLLSAGDELLSRGEIR